MTVQELQDALKLYHQRAALRGERHEETEKMIAAIVKAVETLDHRIKSLEGHEVPPQL